MRIVVAAILFAFAVGTAVVAAPGITVLPNAWRIRANDGPVAAVGTLPEGIVLSRDGTRAVEIEGGHAKPALRVFDAATLHEVRSVKLNGAFGVPLRDADGDGVWISVAGTFQEQIAHVDVDRGVVDRGVSLPVPFFPVALARSRTGLLAVAGDLANRVALVDPASEGVTATIAVGRHPAALAFSSDGATLYVADRAESDLDVIDVGSRAVRGRIRVGLHPVALAQDAARLYVADSDDDDVAVIDLASNRVVQRITMPFSSRGLIGASPNALALDGDRLYVTCGAANALVVFRVESGRLSALGAIPTGWYPTGVAIDRSHGALYIADGKGESGHPNPQFSPEVSRSKQYVADQLVGSIRRTAIPDEAALRAGLADVRALGAPFALTVPSPSPILRRGGPISHVIYVIKENRSYDQVLGDIAGADGDPALVLFGENVTPNEHAIARRYGVFDRFFENAHVSADGHNWSTAAFANDYLEKMWPPNYASRRPFYDFEDGAEAAMPRAGYIWDDAVAHGVTFRNYGEFVSAGASAPTPVSAASALLRAHTDRNFATFDNAVRDMDRFAEWKREFDAFERSRTLPQLEIVRFPRDHTSGTRAGENTPQAMVADNDQAVGHVVDAVSHSVDWASTAIFVIEDDAQNGPDHVDEQRSTFYLASPYAAGGTRHETYTQASVLRTIEMILGLPPMTPYDAGAAPMTDAFGAVPNKLETFSALAPRTDVQAVNRATAYRSGESGRLDFAHADAVDDAVLNDILWHAVRGPHASCRDTAPSRTSRTNGEPGRRPSGRSL